MQIFPRFCKLIYGNSDLEKQKKFSKIIKIEWLQATMSVGKVTISDEIGEQDCEALGLTPASVKL